MIRLIQMTSFLAVAATLGVLAWVAVDDGRGGKPREAAAPVVRPAGADNAGKDRPGRVILRGRVLTPDGRPVAGATAYNLSANWDVTVLDGADFVAVGLEPDRTRTVSFVHKGRRLAGTLLASAGEGPVDVRLAPCGSASGRLVDPDGQPIADAAIRAMPLDHEGRVLPGMVGNEHFATDRDGRFRIEGINPELGVALDIFPRTRPDRFYQPEPDRREVLRRLKARSGESVDLGEMRMSLPAD